MQPPFRSLLLGSGLCRTDSKGNGAYAATLSESPFGEWAMIMVVLHTNGNPKDMKSMKGALKAPIPTTG
jgi:predicted protein tyrosine phosphatase